jgi:ascorbate PTS system EIIB component
MQRSINMGKGKRGLILVWIACPAGVGSSTIIKLQIEDVLRAHKLDRQVELETVSENHAMTEACDILLGTLNIANRLETRLKIPVVGIKNVMSNQEYEEKLLPVIRKLLETNPQT